MRPFDELARDYDELLRDPLRDRFASGSDFFIEQKARIVSSRLAALTKRQPRARPLRVLDAGCGRGTAFQFFGPGIRVFGCDVSAPMLQGATRHQPVAVQEPYTLPLADDTFDAVYAMCVYHHIPPDEQLRHLCELRRVVAPGGEVMVFEHNPYNPVTARVFRRAPIDAGCEMIPPPALQTLFERAGFAGTDRRYLLFVPEAVHRRLPFIEPALAWLPLGGQYFVAGRK
jgi:SAM-dependent methyltransferase